MELNPQRPAHLHAGRVRPVRSQPSPRATWRRHLHNEPPGLLRRLHGVPKGTAAASGAPTTPN